MYDINYSFNIILVFSKETESTKKHKNASNVLPFAKDNLEYVKPFKISQNQYEDPREYLKYAAIEHYFQIYTV